MSFVQSWLLWGLIAAIFPLLIHLLNRWRHKTISWGAMSFLLQANKEYKGKKKLLHYLILILRTLAIICLILALSRPLASQWLGIGAHPMDNIIIVLDRSASMNETPTGSTKNNKDIILEQITATLKTLGNKRVFLADSAQNTVMEISVPELLPQIKDTVDTDTTANIPLLLETAAQYAQKNLAGNTEFWIISDAQLSNWQPTSGIWENTKKSLLSLTTTPPIRLLSPPLTTEPNKSIRVLSALVYDNQLHLSLQIQQQGKELTLNTPQSLPLSISLNGGHFTETIHIQGNTSTLKKIIPLPKDTKEGSGYVELPPDTQNSDNIFFFTFQEEPTLRIGINQTPSPALLALGQMIAPSTTSHRTLTNINPQALTKQDIQELGIILWEGNFPTGKQGDIFQEYVEKGGIIVVIPEDKRENNSSTPTPLLNQTTSSTITTVTTDDGTVSISTKTTTAQTETTSQDTTSPKNIITWGEKQESPEDKYFILNKPESFEGLFRPGDDGKPIPIEQAKAIRRLSIREKIVPLLTWDDGEIALGRKLLGKGQIYILTTRPDYTWSNFADGYILIPLLSRLADYSCAQQGTPLSLDVGNIPFDLNQVFHRIDEHKSESSSKKNILDINLSAGLYQQANKIVAQNRAPQEDAPETIKEQDIQDLLLPLEINTQHSQKHSTDSLVTEIWRTFYILALLCLLGEALLCLPPRKISTAP